MSVFLLFNRIFDLPIGHPLDDVTVEFAENLLISQASALLSLDKGKCSPDRQQVKVSF